MKKNTYYFSHDYNSHNDTKILYMRQDLGMEGYGIYWFLIETLADSGGILPLKIIPVLASQMNVSVSKVDVIINNYQLFQVADNQFFSERLINHLNIRSSFSEKGKEGAKIRWNGGAIRGANAKEKKVKEIKLKEIESTLTNDLSKSNLFREPKIPNKEEVHHAFLNSGGTNEMAEKFFNKYSATGWFLNGSPIVNFKNLLPSFITNYKTINDAKPKSNSSQAKQDGFIEYYNRYSDDSKG